MLLGSAKWEPLQHRKNVREEIKNMDTKILDIKTLLL